MSTVYFKAVKLKGKAHDIPIYYPINLNEDQLRQANKYNIFPELRTHRFSLPANEINVSQDGLVKQEFTEHILKTRQLFMIGREEIHRRVQ